jgi:sugar O-acyltransferase (sialic acid O-acetyltransferase NeuD family)
MRTIIYGNGAMAKTLYSYARHHQPIAGFTVDDCCIPAGEARFRGLPLVPFSRVTQVFDPHDHEMIIAVGYIEMNALRQRKYEEASAMGYRFASYLAPGFVRHDEVEIADNCVILDGVTIHAGSRIGRGTFISSNVNIGHDCQIGENGWISAGVAIAGGCTVGAGSFFGVNAALGHGVALGARNYVGATTLITRSTQDDQVHLSAAGELFPLSSQAFLRFSKVAL